MDLSILIPARNEMFLTHTIDNVLSRCEAKTEIIVGLDGQWPTPSVHQDKRVKVLYVPNPIGQRAMTNQLCRLSKAKYVMKLDAHCAVDQGFDRKLIEDMQDDWTVVPLMYNLHAFDWKCTKCGNRWYQGQSPTKCQIRINHRKHKDNPKCDSKDFVRKIVFRPNPNPSTFQMAFDEDLKFQYSRARQKIVKGDIVETMSLLGACFMLTRKKYWDLNICDEAHGSWGQQGTEVACKTWLSGGKLMCNKKTWFAHMFRTQGGDFSFPYKITNREIEKARKYSKDMWYNNKWPKAVHKLDWLFNKFKEK